jgi:hypothetical protein
MAQADPTHPGVATFAVAGQIVPQRPQFATSFTVFTSQPSTAELSQSAKPGLHAPMPQVPPVQAGAAFAGVGQMVPQPLQLRGSVMRFVSQPVPACVSQFPNPTSQVMSHEPASQDGDPFVASHASPQPLQFAGSARTFTSHPFVSALSQFSNPAAQVMPHAPPLHVAVPLVELHAFTHVPQWAGSVPRFTSQPFTGDRSQLSNPGLQLVAHCPAVQLGVPLFALHATTQEPQWPVSVSRFTSHPVVACPSQSP